MQRNAVHWTKMPRPPHTPRSPVTLHVLPDHPDDSISPLDSRSITADAKRALEEGRTEEAAYILWLCGWLPGEIAKACGYPDWQTVRKVCRRVQRSQQRDQRDVRQWYEVQKLDRLERALQPQVEQGNVNAIETVLKISAERRKILADDEPVRLAPQPLPSDEELERLTRHLKATSGLRMDVPALLADFKEVAQKGGFLPAGSDGETAGDILDAEMAEVVVDAEHEEAESDG